MSKKQKVRKSRWDFKDDEYDEEVDILDSRLKEPLKEFHHSRRGDVDPIMASNQRSRRSPVEMDIIKHHQRGMENMAKKGHVYPSIGASPKKHGFNRVSRSNKRSLDHVLHRTGYLDDGAANLTNKDYLNWDANWNYKVLHQQGNPDTAAKRLEKSKAKSAEDEKTRRKVVFKKKSGGKKKSKYNKRMARKNKRKTRRKKGAKARDGVRSMVAGKKYTKKKRKKKRVKSNKYFKKHYMWNTRGKRYMAKTYKQHVRGLKSGHGHKKPR
jgi:hypothetical protein